MDNEELTSQNRTTIRATLITVIGGVLVALIGILPFLLQRDAGEDLKSSIPISPYVGEWKNIRDEDMVNIRRIEIDQFPDGLRIEPFGYFVKSSGHYDKSKEWSWGPVSAPLSDADDGIVIVHFLRGEKNVRLKMSISRDQQLNVRVEEDGLLPHPMSFTRTK